MAKYIISIDQSTQGTKALLFDETGSIMRRTDRPHRQIINEKGWVSHDPEEIYSNVLKVVKELLEGVEKEYVVGLGISNQRETSLAWNRVTGKPYGNAVVWQCARAVDILCTCGKDWGSRDDPPENRNESFPLIFRLPRSHGFWKMKRVQKAVAERHEICHGTIDSWLVYKLTGGKEYRTDYSNASRTQLFNIFDLKWDEEICGLFGIDPANMAEVTDSDACFGETDFEGLLPHKIPNPWRNGRFPWLSFWTGMFAAWHDQIHLWNRFFYYDEYWGEADSQYSWGCYFSCVENRRQG